MCKALSLSSPSQPPRRSEEGCILQDGNAAFRCAGTGYLLGQPHHEQHRCLDFFNSMKQQDLVQRTSWLCGIDHVTTYFCVCMLPKSLLFKSLTLLTVNIVNCAPDSQSLLSREPTTLHPLDDGKSKHQCKVYSLQSTGKPTSKNLFSILV